MFFLGYQNPKKKKKSKKKCWRRCWRKFFHPLRSGASLSQRGETAGFLRSSSFQVVGPKRSVGENHFRGGFVLVGFLGKLFWRKNGADFFFFVGGGGGGGAVVFVGVEAFGSG